MKKFISFVKSLAIFLAIIIGSGLIAAGIFSLFILANPANNSNAYSIVSFIVTITISLSVQFYLLKKFFNKEK